jgi:type I restriction enzyme S subunit
MTNWEDFKLTEVGSLKRGKSKHRPRYAFHLYGGQYPFIQTGEIKAARKYINSYNQTYSEAGLQQSKLWPANTLCITIAANIAEIAILSFEACFPDSVIGFIPEKEKCNLDYAYYTLKFFQKELQSFGEGSVQDNINLGTFEGITFPFPLLPEQEAIAEVLSSLDDKIDLLHKQNQKLEDLAEILYRQWFIVEADPEGDEVFLSDVANHHKNNIKPFENPFQEYFHYSIPAFDDGNNPQIEVGDTIRSNKYQVLTNSILISKLNPRFPRVWQISKEIDEEVSICSTEFQVVVPHEQQWFPFIYYFLKSRPVTDELIGAAGGTSGSHQRVSPDDIFNLSFIKPKDDKLKQFFQITTPNLEKINNNREQLLKLEKLRNTLLPKLMSGELRVKIDDK